MKQSTKEKLRKAVKMKLRNPNCKECNGYLFRVYVRGKGKFVKLEDYFFCPTCSSIFVLELNKVKKESLE